MASTPPDAPAPGAPASNRRALRGSVRGFLVLLTISLLIPALVATALLLERANRQNRDQLEEQLMATARALSGAVDRQVAEGVAVAETLATDQALLNGDWGGFYTRAKRTTANRPGWIVVASLDGQQMVNTLVPWGAPLPTTPPTQDMVQQRETGRTLVSDLRMGAMAKRYVITVGAPVQIKGKAYVVTYVVESASFASVFRQQRAPERWVATILDNQRKVIARSVRNERWTGATASPDMARNLARSSEGVNKSVSLENVKTLVAYTRSPRTGWTLVVAIPRAEAARAGVSLALGTATVFPFLLLLGIGLALFFANRVNREVAGLVEDAATIGEGRPLSAGRGDGLAEIAAVREALVAASRELEAREARQAVMINELNHRVKNNLATVQSLARQTFAKLDAEQVRIFTERLVAFSAAHDLLTRTGWTEADLIDVVATCVRAHGDRIDAAGPSVALSPHVAVSLSMVLHELATNSAKYGGLSAPDGRVALRWSLDEEARQLRLTWIESGGPAVSEPSTFGFGARLIENLTQRELKGRSRFDFRPEGLCFEAWLPLASVQRWRNDF
ncbi:sensor histidine kinase [Caulobacter hibisci]|uniref:histidine kinase n=1 Tax=Caulobacter hibisci TaxID=2035993 RepID=A0ABS0SX78_9CAUL|nr:HWE histidine kinase domain-containing protein [Caulobacter hibisci]MBI1683866.1 histidine kinase [Caulobacter hibisci]